MSLHRLSLLTLLTFGCTPKIAGVDGELGEPADIGTDGDDGSDGVSDGDDGGEVDADGDGYTAEDDCDDDDPDANPDAEEVFDGTDNDCDGWVDEVEVCDEPDATLQEVIDASPDGATLLICAGTWDELLDLSDRELMLVGVEGAESTTISGGGEGVPLTVSGDAEVTVMGLTLADGVGELGGGASCRGANLHFIDAVVRDSEATRGGGIYARSCELIVETSLVADNVATEQGGGVYAEECSGGFFDSSVDGNLGLEGGGAFLFGGSIEVSGGGFTANEATTTDESTWGSGSGGGGLWTSSTGAVAGTRIAENHSGYNGGGVYFYRGRPTLQDSDIADNTCDEDGAGAYFNISQGQIVGNTFSGNAAADDAGGLRFFYGGSVVEGNTFIGNSANDDGGGAKFSHSEHVFRNNVMEDNVAGDAGGGLELDNDSSHVEGSTFRNNRAYRGAGLHNWRTETTFTIETSVFEGNVASDCGGGLSFDNSPYRITLSQLELHDNEAADGAGFCVDRVYRDPDDVGGVENYFQVTLLNVRNSAMWDNDAADDGGAAYIRAGDVNFVNVTFDGNSGPDGGALSVKGSPVTLNNAILTNHSGPALWVEDTEDAAGSIAVSYSDLWGNDSVAVGMDSPVGSNGNISEDPDFSSGDFQLRGTSPCVDAGDPSINDRDGSRSDMGWHGGPDAP